MPHHRLSSLLRFCYFWLMFVFLLPALGHAGTFTAYGPKTLTRQTGTPVTVTDTFTVNNPNTQYTLHVVNGGLQDDTADFVSSGTVTVNGVMIIVPQDLNQNVTTLDKPVQLQTTNTISVELHGKPGGQLSVQIIGIDNDPPVIAASASPAANSAGWNNTSVNVGFSCTDAISGVASCSSPVTVAGEGSGQVITGTAIDFAGNAASTSVTLNIDKTAPAITITAPVNGAAVSGTSLNVTGSVSDTLSGVAAATVTCNGSAAVLNGTSFSCTVSLVTGINTVSVAAGDQAGNPATQSISVTAQLASPTQYLQPVQVNPVFVSVNTPATVTATVRIDVDATLIPGSVTLYRVDENDQIIAPVGQMYDDGTHGDSLKGDNVFSITVPLNEAAPAILFFRAAASYKNLDTPVFSDFARVFVQATRTAEQDLADLANAIEAGDITTALTFFPPSPKTTDTLTKLNDQQRTLLVAALRSLTLINATDDVRVYRAPWVDPDGVSTYIEFGVGRDMLGKWLIFSW